MTYLPHWPQSNGASIVQSRWIQYGLALTADYADEHHERSRGLSAVFDQHHDRKPDMLRQR